MAEPTSPTNASHVDNQPASHVDNQPASHVDNQNSNASNSGVEVTNTQGPAPDGAEITHTTLITTDPNSVVQITEDLTGIVSTYNDEINSQNGALVAQIQMYAGQIKCSDFHGKGTIEDYTELFQAASKIANDTKQMQLDIDVDGFSEFGVAADELSALFTSFIVRLQNVNIIDDTAFLTSISIALQKICNLSEVFGRFKETILATSTIQMPKSAHDTKVILENVMSEVNCAMKYIGNFVTPDSTLVDANLTSKEQEIISTAISTIDNWNVLCDQGVSIAMSNNSDVQFINSANASLVTQTTTLKNATSLLRTKMNIFFM